MSGRWLRDHQRDPLSRAAEGAQRKPRWEPKRMCRTRPQNPTTPAWPTSSTAAPPGYSLHRKPEPRPLVNARTLCHVVLCRSCPRAVAATELIRQRKHQGRQCALSSSTNAHHASDAAAQSSECARCADQHWGACSVNATRPSLHWKSIWSLCKCASLH